MTPVFAVVEGIDGSGKSTLVNLVKQGLVDEGKTVWTTAEPTARMRKILEDNPDSYDPVSLFLLFTYDRYNHQREIVENLQDHDVVISDRYILSSYAYQGSSMSGIFGSTSQALDWMRFVSRIITLTPDLTFFLDIKTEVARKRIAKYRSSDLLEKAVDLDRVSAFYSSLLTPEIEKLDATLQPEKLAGSVIQRILSKL
ncbi:MAG: dTMP kinase [Candidatus Thermoplasmatota archaeon]|jgi:dTMP kinase|nr:dTMP kinase [Candidatus Thermoplasmatota archaeon]MCL5439780.1 dTMP kinase [Candidatus Thermoplasmatota archaeon]